MTKDIILGALLGGTGEVMGGGKFANGAVRGAMLRAVNDWGQYNTARKLARDVYDNQDGELLEGMGIKNHRILGFKSALFKGSDGIYYHSFAGTDDYDDVITDLLQGVGIKDVQYELAIKMAKQVYRATNGNVVFVGHSLGGGLAAAAAYEVGGKAITFNAAGLSQTYITTKTPTITSYVIDGEILNYAQDRIPGMPTSVGNRITMEPLNPSVFRHRMHGIDQFPKK